MKELTQSERNLLEEMGSCALKFLKKKWDAEVVPNGWHNQGKAGAVACLMTYGNRINTQRAQALADYAREYGYVEFACGVESAIDEGII